MSKRDIIIGQRDRTFFPSGSCECGHSFWLGRDNHKHYRVIAPNTTSEHEDIVTNRELIDLRILVQNTKEQSDREM